MTVRPAGRLLAAAILATLTVTAAHSTGSDAPALTLEPLDSLKIGNAGSAEIGAYDPLTRRLFVVNFATSSVSVLDARYPGDLKLASTINVSAFGSPNSVAVSRGIVAIAIENAVKTEPGRVGFYRTNGELLATVKVGSQPDMLTFTPDGQYLLVANEGEPSGYTAGYADPEGSVSIIRMPFLPAQVKQLKDGDVRSVGFTRFNGQEAALRSKGIRIYGPNASAAMDFEPEYIAVSPDSRKAYVTLQENNAVAVINIATASVSELLPLGYKDWNAPPYTVASFEWSSAALPAIGVAGSEVLKLGGFSGLYFEGTTADGKLKFITNTDRGPNGEPDMVTLQRPFLLPNFNPRLVRFELDPATGRFTLTQQIGLKDAAGRPLTGLPNTALSNNNNQPYNDEVPVNLRGEALPLDGLGGDFEGVVVDEDGTFWLPDEYRPAIYHFGTTGRLLARYIPAGTHAAAGLAVPAPGSAGPLGIEALPAVIAQRRQNRGMEAIALQNGKLYAFVQSPIRNPAALSNGALNAMRNIRVVEFDPATLATKQFLYVMDNPVPEVGNANDSRADKIGDAVAVPGGGFLVVERDDDAVDSDTLATISKKIYAFKLGAATDITGMDGVYAVASGSKSIDQMTAEELTSVGVTPLAKTLHVDLATAGFAGVEKIEGLALLDDGRLAVVNDNDFTVAGITIDKATGTFTRNEGYVPEPVTVGLISVPGLDPSDRDSAINIRNWPVFGMYQPDTIAAYSAKGRTYLVTANEGDARADWPGLNEEVRIGNAAVVLDPTVFPNASVLKNNANLGRLNITNQLGDVDGDGDYDALYTLGGRSFSIWSTDGMQVFDSDADLERITAAAHPANFNASNDNNNFDDRSDNKGPEPEGLAVGSVGGRDYAFIGLERTGGIAAYDITTPTAPVFVDYVNNRDFSVSDITSPLIGDLGPEGVLFIPAHESPNFRPLLVVTNEISGTVTTYQVEACGRPHRWGAKPFAKWWRWFDRSPRCTR